MVEKGRIFITGHSGFVGHHLLTRIIEDASLRDRLDLRWKSAQEGDTIIHLAAKTHTSQFFDPALIESNFILTNEIFKSKARILYASSCSARYDSSPYAQSKMYSEYRAVQHGNATGFRFFNIYGSGNNKGIIKYLMDRHDKERITIRGMNLIRDYIYIDDVIDFIIKHLLLDVSGVKWYDVGTCVGTSTLQLLNLYSELSGKTFDIESVDPLPSDPQVMISNNWIGKISLREGLQKLINQSHEYQIH